MSDDRKSSKRPRHPGYFNRSKDKSDGPAARHFGPRKAAEKNPDQLWIYGVHAVAAVLGNPRRTVLRLLATQNAVARLKEEGANVPAHEDVAPRDLDRLLGAEAVHQGVAVEVAPLEPLALDDLGEAKLIVVLDQVTDPHNVGAILRSAVAFGADALVVTGRHAPAETGVLAKAASGALELIHVVEVPNLARALDELGDLGFTRVGLDSEGDHVIEEAMGGERIALVLGAEGKGLRRLTREKCDVVARLDMPGAIKSLNVSNAAVLSLYLARRHLGAPAKG
ncbi:23S rRNA (guanosine2251-2'-O)-methyltransferase [Kaistia hirudinis]|uniref:23S rRNA (Guanosine2251-2'-O)-methyltransferase n=1 Tax=Kaistia hirudinis TaxID=1293440 RepID=A0A840AN77_9HYPH|nr:23S rRNA (guanosine(2251)-2'-O)-methyltransferase RlmB [Kaistia hirudinis]MBB3929975.1 23S rRNA (guanosine2251-2'-O)-methyltransferase [Kaistia hirudinis]